MVPVAQLSAAARILAHSSGFTWDEALLVMAPIAAVAGVLFLVNNRAKKLGTDDRTADEADEAPPDAPV